MNDRLLAQLVTWNPWWQQGAEGIQRYHDPAFKRELFGEVFQQVERGEHIVSIVGMRQIGKSTMMRQAIQQLLSKGIDPTSIFYVSFDDPYLKINFDQRRLFQEVLDTYLEGIRNSALTEERQRLYLFLDEIHQLPNWETTLKSYYDRAFPFTYVVSGSSSMHLQKKHRESLLGRISEHVLWPFSFREFVAFKAEHDPKLTNLVASLRTNAASFLRSFSFAPQSDELLQAYQQASVWHKPALLRHLKSFLVSGGFPRSWKQPDFVSRQRFLWEQHVGKVIYEDLVQTANIRRPKDLEVLLARLIDFNGREFVLRTLQRDLGVHWVTLDRYLGYLMKTFLVFRVESTKSKRVALKRRSGNVKFYLTDVAIRNAYYKFDETVYGNPQEMSVIAENLVCSTIQRWLVGPHRDEQIGFYRDRSGEVDFIFKQPSAVLPIEVKWRTDVPALKTLDKVVKTWKAKESLLVTKDFDLTYQKGRLSIPLWFFLLAF